MSNQDKRPSVDMLHRLFIYNQATGELIKRSNSKRAGYIDSKGYRQIMIKGWRGRVHQVAYAMKNGEWAEASVDHINRDTTDDRAVNLRAATTIQNFANQKSNGAVKLGTKYRSEISTNGQRINLGIYRDRESAAAIYAFADVFFNGEYSCTESKESVKSTLMKSIPEQVA